IGGWHVGDVERVGAQARPAACRLWVAAARSTTRGRAIGTRTLRTSAGQASRSPPRRQGVDVILALMLIGLAIALDPLPLASYLGLLPSKRGVQKGAVFIFGWLVSLAVIVAITVAATGNNPPKSQTAPSLAALAAKIAIGVVLVGLAIRQRRRMGRPKK